MNTPISPYAASKKAAEVMTYTYHFLYGLDVSVVRYFTVYGPAGDQIGVFSGLSSGSTKESLLELLATVPKTEILHLSMISPREP